MVLCSASYSWSKCLKSDDDFFWKIYGGPGGDPHLKLFTYLQWGELGEKKAFFFYLLFESVSRSPHPIFLSLFFCFMSRANMAAWPFRLYSYQQLQNFDDAWLERRESRMRDVIRYWCINILLWDKYMPSCLPRFLGTEYRCRMPRIRE